MKRTYTILEQRELVKQIREELKKYPEFDPESNEPYERVKFDNEMLQEIFFGGSNVPNFFLTEMRKMDLSAINFDHKLVRRINYSYTNININPQTVMGKLLSLTNLEGVDLSEKSFEGVDIDYTNLTNTGATIDMQTVKSAEGAILEGCTIIGEKEKSKTKKL